MKSEPPFQVGNRDAAFLRAFESLSISPQDFHHAEHLRAAWCCLASSRDFSTGAARFIRTFRRYLRKVGAREKYHETITWFFLLEINARMRTCPATGWERFRTLNRELFDDCRGLIRRRYRPATLGAAAARRVFHFPDGVWTGFDEARGGGIPRTHGSKASRAI